MMEGMKMSSPHTQTILLCIFVVLYSVFNESFAFRYTK